jgi:hypothetical protein
MSLVRTFALVAVISLALPSPALAACGTAGGSGCKASADSPRPPKPPTSQGCGTAGGSGCKAAAAGLNPAELLSLFGAIVRVILP